MVLAIYLALGIVLLPLAVAVVAGGCVFKPDWRAGVLARFGLTPPRRDRPVVVWCASVGEVNTAQRLARELARRTGAPALLAVYTPSGLARARELFGPGGAALAPLDILPCVWLWLNRVRPRLVVLFETELWPAFAAVAHGRGVRLALVNGRLSDRSFPRYRRVRWLLRPTLRRLDLIAAQTPVFADRFRQLGAPEPRVLTTGSLKYDVVVGAAPPPSVQEFYRAFGEGRRVLVAGSTHAGEEKLLADAVRELRAEFPDLALIAAPRHLKRADEAAADLAGAGLSVGRRSAGAPARADALLLDAVGELGWVYGRGQAAFVGGSFTDAGGHNVLEPAAVGAPVVVGPKTPNFRLEVETLQAAGGLVVAADGAALRRAIGDWLRDDDRRRRAAEAGRGVVAAHRGATDRVAALVAELNED